ncbi:hypothetical protein [Nocardia sp. NPDC052566]|uniref:hypothetical protein n=1 Tax=Nocardia sp. NPDC052566 TaxID=3364330 RepID=UPI0037C61E92
MAFDFNVDVKLTDAADPDSVQFINMTIDAVPAGVTQLSGTWRGASVFVPASNGEFDWDGRPGHEVAFVFDGSSSGARLVLGLLGFIGASGKLPGRGTTGDGEVLDPTQPAFRGEVRWKVT